MWGSLDWATAGPQPRCEDVGIAVRCTGDSSRRMVGGGGGDCGTMSGDHATISGDHVTTHYAGVFKPQPYQGSMRKVKGLLTS